MSKRKDISPAAGQKEQKKMNFLNALIVETGQVKSTVDINKDARDAKSTSKNSLYESTSDLLASAKQPAPHHESTTDILNSIEMNVNDDGATTSFLDPALSFGGVWHGMYIDSIIVDIVSRNKHRSEEVFDRILC